MEGASVVCCRAAVTAADGRATGEGDPMTLTGGAATGDATATGEGVVSPIIETELCCCCCWGVRGAVVSTSCSSLACATAAAETGCDTGGTAGAGWDGAAAGGAGGAGAGFGLGLIIVEAPRLQADVGGRFDCAHASPSSSFIVLIPLLLPAPALTPLIPPPPTGSRATGSCALLDQPSLSIVLDAAPTVPPPPPQPPAESSPEEAVTLGPCAAEGALPPTAAAQPPLLSGGDAEAGVESSGISLGKCVPAVSVQPLPPLVCCSV